MTLSWTACDDMGFDSLSSYMNAIYFFSFKILRKHCDYGVEIYTDKIICTYNTPFKVVEGNECCEERCPWTKDAVKLTSPEPGD